MQAAGHDYLSPFLPSALGAGSLTREQALEVREKCLKALKDRLIERANIVQVNKVHIIWFLHRKQIGTFIGCLRGAHVGL